MQQATCALVFSTKSEWPVCLCYETQQDSVYARNADIFVFQADRSGGVMLCSALPLLQLQMPVLNHDMKIFLGRNARITRLGRRYMSKNTEHRSV